MTDLRPSERAAMGRNTTVDEGVAIMQAWCRYLGVNELTTTVIVPPDFSNGFLAARDYYGERIAELERERDKAEKDWSAYAVTMNQRLEAAEERCKELERMRDLATTELEGATVDMKVLLARCKRLEEALLKIAEHRYGKTQSGLHWARDTARRTALSEQLEKP
jgi:hypothetical protein